MTLTTESTRQAFNCPDYVPALLEVLFTRLGIDVSGSAAYPGAAFPTNNDDTATFRNEVFAVRRFLYNVDGDLEDDFEYANFEHFRTGLKLRFYKHLYRSCESNIAIDSPQKFYEMLQECFSSIPPDHQTGEPPPDFYGRIASHDIKHDEPHGPKHRALKLTVVDDQGERRDLISFGSTTDMILRIIAANPNEMTGFRVRHEHQRHMRRRRDVIVEVKIPESLKSPFED